MESYSYVEVAVMVSLLIESQALDFVVTGGSSGQGMILACNSLQVSTVDWYKPHKMLSYLAG